jgi:hypothetical protein
MSNAGILMESQQFFFMVAPVVAPEAFQDDSSIQKNIE